MAVGRVRETRTWRWGDPVEPLRACLDRGGVLAIPTESSYGLAVRPDDERAVRQVFDLKRRPEGEPLPVVGGNRTAFESLGVELDDPAFEPVIAAWPAALSLIAPLTRRVAAAGGGETLAVRVPKHAALRGLLLQLDLALTATSANRSGQPAILEPTALQPLLRGADAWILDDGVLPGGAPSTLVRHDEGGWQVLRRGRYDFDPTE